MSELSDAVAHAEQAASDAIAAALAEGARRHQDTAVRLLYGEGEVRVQAVFLPAGSDASNLRGAGGSPWMVYGTATDSVSLSR